MSNPFLTSMVKLYVPPHMGNSVSLRGFTMEPDGDRCVEVPADAAPDLMGHGLIAVPVGRKAGDFAAEQIAGDLDVEMRKAPKGK